MEALFTGTNNHTQRTREASAYISEVFSSLSKISFKKKKGNAVNIS
jgi:plasmid replication initiation protein